MSVSLICRKIACVIMMLCLLCPLLCPLSVSADADTGYTNALGYSTLQNDEERQAYTAIYTAVKNKDYEAAMPQNSGFIVSDVGKIATLVAYDLPEVFYFGGGIMCVLNPDETVKKVRPLYWLDEEKFQADPDDPEVASKIAELETREQMLKIKIQEIISGMPSDAGTDAEKAKYFHDYLVKNIAYKVTSNDQTIYGALIQNECVCAGYSAAFHTLCNAVGIKCGTITGSSTDNSGVTGRHAWNVIWIDGKCLYTDVTWDDVSTLSYRYFNISGTAMNKDHQPDEVYATTLGTCNHQSSVISLSATIKISLDKTDAILYSRGDTCTLHATVTSEGNIKKTLEWSTSDNNVAIVDNNGVVTAVGSGKATITVTHIESGATAKCAVTVESPKPHQHTIEPASGRDATCTETGIKNHFKCSSCGVKFYDAEGNQVITSDKELEIAALGHKEGELWGSDSEKHWKTCEVCSAALESTQREHHVMDGVCGDCGYIFAPNPDSEVTEPPTSEPEESTPSATTTEPSETTSISTEPSEATPTEPAEGNKPQSSNAVIIFGILLCAGMAAAAIYVATKPKRP